MGKNSEWEGDDYRDFKKPKKVVNKDKLGKHRNAIYDMLDNEVDEDYFNDNYLDEDYDEDDERY